MRILLIAPPLYRFGGRAWNTFHLGLGYIAAVLRNDGYETAIYDANMDIKSGRKFCPPRALLEEYEAALRNARHPVWQEVEMVIRNFKPHAVGITCKVPDIKSAIAVARIAKGVDNKCFTIVGGPAATTSADLLLRERCLDFAVRGEGETTILELLRTITADQPDFSWIAGLSFRAPSGIVHNKNRPLIQDIDALPFPARDLLLFSDRLSQRVRRGLMGHLVTSRGCPYSCTYCANHAVWGARRVRMRSAESVVAEVLHIRDVYGVRRMILWDDHLTTQRDRIMKFSNLMIEKQAGVQWLSYVRADTVDAELLSLMRRAGCYELQMGVESGSDLILKRIKKGVTLEQIRKTARLLRESGLRWRAFLMIGFPGETLEEMQATMRLLYELQPDSAELNVVTPYPGTELFENTMRQGSLELSSWLVADRCRPESALVDTMPQDVFRDLALGYINECDKYNADKVPWYRRAARPVVRLVRRIFFR